MFFQGGTTKNTSAKRELTETEADQRETEKTLSRRYLSNAPPNTCKMEPLARARHVGWLCDRLEKTTSVHLDSSRPWLVYWPLHALDLMGAVPHALKQVSPEKLFEWLFKCWTYINDQDGDSSNNNNNNNENNNNNNKCEQTKEVEKEVEKERCLVGGFAGGAGQHPHLASCWAACASLIILAHHTPKLRPLLKERLDREALTRWLCSIRLPDGGFKMFVDGEVDLRATYCAACIATVFDLDASVIFPPECLSYVGYCQSFDGGLSSNIHGCESHGGYVSCGFLGLVLMHALRENQKRRREERQQSGEQKQKQKEGVSSSLSFTSFSVSQFLDQSQLRRWCVMRQDVCTGGFCGRVNKLVDSCYSWWVGGTMATLGLVEALENIRGFIDDENNRNKTTTSSSNQKEEAGEKEQAELSSKITMLARSLFVVQNSFALPKNEIQRVQQELLKLVDRNSISNNNNSSKKEGKQEEEEGMSSSTSNQQQSSSTSSSSSPSATVASGMAAQAATTATSWLDDDGADDGGDYSYHQDSLAEYVLELCQTRHGGLCDKPDLNPDLYHTCYSLSGLSVSVADSLEEVVTELSKNEEQEKEEEEQEKEQEEEKERMKKFKSIFQDAYLLQQFEARDSVVVAGFTTHVDSTSFLCATHPLLNLTRKRVAFALQFFGDRESLL